MARKKKCILLKNVFHDGSMVKEQFEIDILLFLCFC